MNRDEKEMALWRQFAVAVGFDTADAAVERFRKRFPPQPVAPEAVWYDEPPFPKDGVVHRCWVEGFAALQGVYWLDMHSEWRFFERMSDTRPLNRRRVCPIVKPPEPTP